MVARTTIDEWIETIANANRKIGLQTILVFIGIGFFTGLIPSVLTTAHTDIFNKLEQNQVLLVGMYSFKYAECLNKIEADSGGNQELWRRGYVRCNQARDDTNRFMKSLNVPSLDGRSQ